MKKGFVVMLKFFTSCADISTCFKKPILVIYHQFLIALIILAPTALSAAVLSWPGAAPCNTTLQVCIDNAGVGDTVEIATDGPITESVTIDAKSLILRPAVGFTPVFATPNSVSAFGDDIDVTVTIEGLTIERGGILTRQGGEGTFTITIRNNVIQNTFTFGNAIEVSSGNTQPPYGPTLFDVSGNQIQINVDPTDQVSAISIGGFQGPGNIGSVVGNTIEQFGGDQNGVIDIGNGSVDLTIDVIGNRVSGSDFNEGVGIFQFAAGGSVTARIINNLLTGQVNEAGVPAAISLNVSRGSGIFTVVNNTVTGNETGVIVNGRADLGATIQGVFANNIIAFNTDIGLSIDSDFAATFVNEYNLVFGNNRNSFTPGPGTINSNPVFVGGSDFHLQATSPAVNMGDNSAPSIPATDADGNPRIFGGTVDMGAFELQQAAVPTTPGGPDEGWSSGSTLRTPNPGDSPGTPAP